MAAVVVGAVAGIETDHDAGVGVMITGTEVLEVIFVKVEDAGTIAGI